MVDLDMMKTRCQQLTLRIAYDKRNNLLGTGTLILRPGSSNALIFTAAHVVWKLLQKAGKAHLYFDCFEADHTCHSWDDTFAIAAGEGEEINQIYIPKDYDPVHQNNDAAILITPHQDWMDRLIPVAIGETAPPSYKKLYGWGYPAAGQETAAGLKKTDAEYERECATLSGTVEVNNGAEIKLLYDTPGREKDVGRDEEMPGYSGSALYDFSDGKEGVYIGCVSGSAGDEAHGSRIYLTAARVFLALMEANGIERFPDKDKLPESLVDYLEEALAMIPQWKKSARDHFAGQLEDWIYSGKLTASSFFAEDADCCASMCEDCRKKGISRCTNYWKGQLIKAFCFCVLEGKDLAELQDLKRIVNDLNEPVSIEFVCSEENGDDFIANLLKNRFRYSGKQIRDGSVFLWNHEGEYCYNSAMTWDEINSIMVSVVDSSNSQNRKSAWEIKSWIKEGGYDIINGQLPVFNFAMIGIGKLVETVINSNAGNRDNMIRALQNVLDENWRKS